MRQNWVALWGFLVAVTSVGYAASLPQIGVPNVAPREGNGNRQFVFPIRLSKAANKTVQVKVATKNGTAQAGQDYIAASQTLKFAPGVREMPFQVTLKGDTLDERDETFFIVASAPGFTALNPAATCTIRDDDEAPAPIATPRPTATPAPTPTQVPTQPSTASVRFVGYNDTWPDASERWWDIGSRHEGMVDSFNVFNDWLSNGQPNSRFDYSTRAANVVITYQRAPSVPYFVGHISARGLKPNFAYQLKLAGKPVGGPRGTGTRQSYVLATNKTPGGTPLVRSVRGSDGQTTPINGDDWTNQQLGYVGRWWNDSNASENTNAITDEVYMANTTDTIYGYQFIGDFVTDSKGNAETNITGNRSFHITWQEWQDGVKDVFFGSFPVSGFLDRSVPPHYYGYGSYAPATRSATGGQTGASRVGLWYELQSGRPNPVVLPPGTYHCRMLITEETFHNLYGDTANPLGGKWKTVMATEDRDITSNAPDAEAGNDIVFTIR